MKTMSRLFLVFLIHAIVLQVTHAGTLLTVSLDSCSSSSSFTLNDASIVCAGSSSGSYTNLCSWGSSAFVTGNYTIGDDGLLTQNPSLTVNAWGAKVYSSSSGTSSSSNYNAYYDDSTEDEGSINLCNGVTSTSSSSSSSCPAAGTYNFLTNVTLPAARTFSVFSSGFRETAAVNFIFDDGSDDYENVMCSFTVQSRNYSYSSTNSVAFVLVLGAAYCMKKRRYATGISNGDGTIIGDNWYWNDNASNEDVVLDDDDARSTHFEMMKRT